MSDTKARYTDRGLNVLSNLGEMMQARMEDGEIKVLWYLTSCCYLSARSLGEKDDYIFQIWGTPDHTKRSFNHYSKTGEALENHFWSQTDWVQLKHHKQWLLWKRPPPEEGHRQHHVFLLPIEHHLCGLHLGSLDHRLLLRRHPAKDRGVDNFWCCQWGAGGGKMHADRLHRWETGFQRREGWIKGRQWCHCDLCISPKWPKQSCKRFHQGINHYDKEIIRYRTSATIDA